MGSETRSGPSILLVEDSPVVSGAMKMVLEWEGYRVACAANGREALDHLRHAERPAVILLDLNMPVMDGWEFREELKHNPALASIPVVAVSGVEDAGDLEAAGCIRKPFDPGELLEAVRQAGQQS
jgi:CheY-like chemotaxis protein